MTLIKQQKAGSLKVKVYDSRDSMGKASALEAAELIKRLLKEKDELNIVFASAPSQNEFIDSLIKDKDIEWERINAFHMDEYIGLDPDAPQGFGNFLKEKIFSKVNLKSAHYINGNAENMDDECDRYTRLLKEYPTDIVFMGIGENGHIAFNDPHVAYFNDDKMVKVVDLDLKCRNQQVNDVCFKIIDEVPTHAITLTIPALVEPEYIFCVVPGSNKAKAVYETVKGKMTQECPASILQKHDNAILYTDSDSASLII